jgi:hypothetical protein
LLKEFQTNGRFLSNSMREKIDPVINEDISDDLEASNLSIFKQYENDLSRYMQQKAYPNFFRQCFANFKRRLL